jgi:signal transduction histidine kinase
MNGVIGMTELLLLTPLDDDQQEYAATVASSANSLLVLLNDILDFSQLDAKKLTLQEQAFDLHNAIEEVMTLAGPEAGAKNLRLELEYPEQIPRCWVGDPSRVRQIVSNLVGNAVKFTPRGRIRVEVASAEGIVIQVRDTGIGIPAGKLDMIFEKFTQVDGRMSRRYGGAGLGLSIVKALVELMGGSVGVKSREGEGSLFRVELPLTEVKRLSTAPAELGAAVKEAPCSTRFD